jgi:hypothetical protein
MIITSAFNFEDVGLDSQLRNCYAEFSQVTIYI